MKIVFRLLTACLLICLMLPQQVQAGGDKRKDPFEIGEKYFARQDYGKALQYYRKALGQNDVRLITGWGLFMKAQVKTEMP